MPDILNDYKNAGTVLQDAVKTLRTNIRFSSVDNPIKTIVMTSVLPHEGKSTLSIFLSIAMAEIGQKTLLIECDCRKPMLRNYFNIRPQYGIMDVLRREVAADKAVVHTQQAGLDVLSSTVLANPVEILGSERMQTMIGEFKKIYDVIILDTPPLGSFIEAAVLASKADGTVLVINQGSTQIERARAVVSQLEKAKAHVLGVVLNNVEMSSSDYYYSDYYYRDGRKKKRKHKSESTETPVNARRTSADTGRTNNGVQGRNTKSRKITGVEEGTEK